MAEEKEQVISETIDDLQTNNQEEVIEEAVEETILDEQIVKENEIVLLTKEKEDLEDKLLRLQAELANIQKRQAKERQDLLRFRSQKLATDLLPVLDNLERALSIEINDNQIEALKKGIEMAHESFLNTFNANDIKRIDALNQPFDPNYHHAVQQVPALEGQESDTVVDVLQEGYILHERVIRPAMVVVTN